MSQKDYTDVTIILDRSGSMQNIWTDTVGGITKFVEDQQAIPGVCLLTLLAFDTGEPVFVCKGKNVTELSGSLLDAIGPRNGTALLDAIGKAINEAGERFKNLPEDQRPEHVVFVISTDGEENSSQEFKHPQIMEMIKTQTDVYKWHFLYLGANQDAIKVGTAMGMPTNNNLCFAANSTGVGAVYRSSSAKVGLLRSAGVTPEYNDEDRAEQEKAGLAGSKP